MKNVVRQFMTDASRRYVLVETRNNNFVIVDQSEGGWIPERVIATTLTRDTAGMTLEKHGFARFVLSEAVYCGAKILISEREIRPFTVHKSHLLFSVMILAISEIVDGEIKKCRVEDITPQSLLGYANREVDYTKDKFIKREIVSLFITISLDDNLDSRRVIGITEINKKSIELQKKKNPKPIDEFVIDKMLNLDKQNETRLKKRERKWKTFQLMHPRRTDHNALEEAVNRMLRYDKYHRLYVEKKIDGCRCYCEVEVLADGDRRVTLYKKGGEMITSQPCLVKLLESITQGVKSNVILDGELCTPDEYYISPNEVSGVANTKTPSKHKLKYVIFDMVYLLARDMPHQERMESLDDIMNSISVNQNRVCVNEKIQTETYEGVCNYMDQIKEVYQENKRRAEEEDMHPPDEVEGIVLRGASSPYDDSKASKTMRKFKFVSDGEYRCVGVDCSEMNEIKYQMAELDDDNSLKNFFTAILQDTVENRQKLYKLYKNKKYDPVGEVMKIRFRTKNEAGLPKEAVVMAKEI